MNAAPLKSSNMGTVRPSKRKRSDEPDPAVSRSSEFWLEDGTVIIEAIHVQFRVHRGTLSMHSEFFKRMFEAPQPEDVQIICGCPVVDVTDKSKDWDALLKMLYRPLEVMQQVDDLPDSFFASITWLGKKYEFTDIARAGLTQLKERFGDPMSCMTKGRLGTVYPVIAVVDQLKIDVLRPSLYYWCLRNMTPLQIANGVVDPHTKTAIRLPASFRDNLIVYRDAVRLSFISHVWLPLYQTKSGVCQTRTCDAPLQQHVAVMLGTPVKYPRLENHTVPGVCSLCQMDIWIKVSAGLESFFKQLPLCFRMKEYSQLEDYADAN